MDQNICTIVPCEITLLTEEKYNIYQNIGFNFVLISLIFSRNRSCSIDILH